MPADDGADGFVLRDGHLLAFEIKLGHVAPDLTPADRRDVSGALERLVAALNPEAVYLFGSYARRTALKALSDVDLLVVLPASDEPAYRRAQHAYSAVGEHAIPLDIVVLTRAEFDERRAVAGSVQAEVARDGRLLYAA
jgi:predicted nucleotidyltransferase